MKKLLSILLVAMSWLACKKGELPPDETGDPVFAMQFTAGGATQSFIAGENNYYQFTRFVTDPVGVVVCSGSLAPVNCPAGDCTGSLTIEFRNLSTGAQVFPDELFREGEFQYSGSGTDTTIGYRGYFKANGNYNDFSWKFDGLGPFSTTSDTISYIFTSAGYHKVELTAFGNQTSIIERSVSSTGATDTLLNVNLRVNHDSLGYTLEALATGLGQLNYDWSTGDNSPVIFISDTISSADNFDVTVTDNFQDTAFARLQGLSGNLGLFETANFTYTMEPVTVTQTFDLGAIAIQWVDAQGVVWRSDRNDQLQDASFTVLETAGYDLNENGQKTRKMRVAFVCRLFSDNGGAMNFSGEGVIGVAYP